MDDIAVRTAPYESFVVHPKGRLNVATAPALRQALADLIRDGRTRLVVDLVDVKTIDSSGVGALIAGLKWARQAGGDLRIVEPSTQVVQILEMTSLTRVLPTYPSADAAFAD